MDQFVLQAPYAASGDQPQAINALARGVQSGMKNQVLLGVTGSGKTFTMASVIEKVQKPTLVIAHNKTLAAQLCSELRAFFPDSRVEYFVSYYDYYQPEAYIASSDTYIEKDASINEEIDRLRHSATAALRERRDVIIVASVSCIYSMGDPSEYEGQMVSLRPGMTLDRDRLVRNLIDIQYERNDVDFARGTFRVKGDVVEIIPAGEYNHALRIEFFGDEIDRISEIDSTTGHVLTSLEHASIYPATHYATDQTHMEENLAVIEHDLRERIAFFKDNGKPLEAERIEQRTTYDMEMMREIGYCQGIENYSRYFDGRKPGDAPYSLLDYFPEDFLCFIDESHVTIPQIRAMYNGDRARKTTLVEYGFRLPSAYDNRPLLFDEFKERIHQTIYVSATPGPYERELAEQTVEQIIRPTGLLDPEIVMRRATGQVDDLVGEIRKVTENGGRILVTTLTKRMAESLTDYLQELGIRVRYLHSDIMTIERMQLIRDLRLGEYDVLVGINLLREGLDLPEVQLVAILDADKEGFLRSETSLVQTVGRAARNVDGRVIMYGDMLTESMEKAITETNRRRALQKAYNEEHGITPETVRSNIRDVLEITKQVENELPDHVDEEERAELIRQIEDQMLSAAAALEFEKAAKLRDQLLNLKGEAPVKSQVQQRRGRGPRTRKSEH
ncbi:MAG: excinuclease ABC subunit UvrB [Clostridia bacterium]|nr:excinuclease ABC subunit UvrB [Clostridia bacterium]MBR1684387.1 excinuclease ABC subunit UvrB [Clostridia bacterium]MBR2288911.1 excinuclease ABC subunit UvrB [Clostridia bacterium]